MKKASSSAPKLSIVTVVLNDLEGLKRTIESIKSLNFTDYEYVVIDGGSDDQSLDFIKNEPTISMWLSEKDNGIYDAMNKGIKNSSGDYVHLLNAGDVYYSSDVFDDSHFLDGKDFLAWTVLKRGKRDIVWSPHKSKTYNSLRIAHPGLIVKRSYYLNNEVYSLDYSLISDSIFILNNVKEDNSNLYQNILVDMDGSGVSTSLSWQNICERHTLINLYDLNYIMKLLLHIRTSIYFLQKIFWK
tara:strand:+ start:623 stop:1351 length:729 start_codon:yes stop_codon:yes gene_type:complete